MKTSSLLFLYSSVGTGLTVGLTTVIYLADMLVDYFFQPRSELVQLLFVFAMALVSVYAGQQCIRFCREVRTLPPGPWGIPVIGYLAFMGREKHTALMELAKRFGSVYCASLGFQLTVVLSDHKMIRAAFGRKDFIGRPVTPFLKTLNGLGIINSIGDLWKEQRRFLHVKLRQFGMTYMGNGRHLMEQRINTEITDLLQALTKTEGRPIDMSNVYAVGVSNVICNMMMSVRFSMDDPKFRRFTFLIEEGMRLFGEVHTVDYIPSVQYLPGKKSACNKIAQNRQDMFAFYREVIDEHKRTFVPGVVRDLIDAYLTEIDTAKKEGRDSELFEGKDHDQQMMQIIGDLFSAGMETVKTTLLWINVYMLRNPEAMRAVQEELDQVVGRDRLPSIEDIPFLPVTEATILESMRRSTIVPLATTHSPSRDVQLEGYTIPAGAHVIPLINAIHMDPKLWDSPDDFNPRRFINAEGKVHKPAYFMPFGVGRRMCLGDTLARMELFLFFSALMHTFDMRLPEGDQLPSLKGIVGVTITPELFNVCLTPRPMNPKKEAEQKEEEKTEENTVEEGVKSVEPTAPVQVELKCE